MTRSSQRGSAMLVTLIIIVALFAGAVVLVTMQLTSNRSSEMSRASTSSLYCAEAGLAAARSVLVAQSSNWGIGLGTASEPTWLRTAIGSHDIDGDGNDDFEVYLMDNDDELEPTPNAPTADIDGKVFVVSRCVSTKWAETPKQVMELVSSTSGGGCYASQEGGCYGNGNAN